MNPIDLIGVIKIAVLAVIGVTMRGGILGTTSVAGGEEAKMKVMTGVLLLLLLPLLVPLVLLSDLARLAGSTCLTMAA